MICHLCESETDFACDKCGEPVCDGCCVKMTIHNHIDYPLCELCGDTIETLKAIAYQQEKEDEEKARTEKEKRGVIRKANYRKPENVEKRRLRKLERQRIKQELQKNKRPISLRLYIECSGEITERGTLIKC